MEEVNKNLPSSGNNLTDQILADTTALNPIDSSKPYVSITDIMDDDPTAVSDEYKNMISAYQTDIDKFGPINMGNINSDLPSPTFSTLPNQNTDTYESQMDSLIKSIGSPMVKEEGALGKPIFENVRSLNFDRQYQSEAFGDIGFTPYADMDDVYNQNMTAYDGWQRGWEQFQHLAGTGFVSSYRSIADFFDGDDYLSSPDLTSAYEMEDAMRIGGSTDGSFIGKAGNLGLNFGYTAGIVASVAFEEVIMAAAAAAGTLPSGGSSWAAFGAGTLNNLRKLGNLFDVSRAAKASRDLVKTLKNIENARSFYNVSRGVASAGLKFVAPELTHAIKNWKTTGNTAKNLLNIGKNTHVFGAFYRDMRMVNASMSESKMEAGMVFNQIEMNGLNYFNYKNGAGKGITEEQAKNTRIKAAEGAFKAQMRNFLIIHASNRIVLKNAFGGWQRKLNQEAQRVLRGTGGKAIKAEKYLFKRIPQELNLAFKTQGWKGVPKVLGSQMLKYAAANLAEGVQEVSQEAISAATIGYYSSLLRDPLAGAPSTYGAFGQQAVGNVFSKEGAEVFASGFFMGGLAGPYQQVLFQGMPAIFRKGQSIYNKSTVKEGETAADPYTEYNAAREKAVDDVVNYINKINDQQMNAEKPLEAILSENQLKLTLQKQQQGLMNLNIAMGDKKEYFDNRNFAEFDALKKAFDTGSIVFLKDNLVNLNKLNDKELVDAFKGSGRSAKSLRNKISTQLERIDSFGKTVTDNLGGIFPTKYDPKQFDPGTEEFIKESFKLQAYEQTKLLYMFTNESFKNAAIRQSEIENRLETEPLIANQGATDIRLLYTKDTIEQEIKTLETEIDAYEDTTEGNKLKSKKQKKKKALEKYLKIFTDPKNLTKKGYFARNKVKTSGLDTAFKNYIEALADKSSDFVDYGKIKEALTLITDHVALQEDASAYSKSVDLLTNPKVQEQLEERATEYLEYIYKNRKTIYKRQTEAFIDSVEKTKLLNGLAEVDILMEESFAREFLQDEISLEDLLQGVNEGKLIQNGRRLNPNVIKDAESLAKAVAIIKNYIGVKVQQERKSEVSDEAVANAEILDIEETLQQAGIDVEVDEQVDSNILNEILKQQYLKYRANDKSSDPLDFSQWSATNEALKIKKAFIAIKRVWAKGYSTTVEEYGNLVERSRIPSAGDIDEEKGFQEYLDSREAIENPIIEDILKQLDLSYDIFTNRNINKKSNLKAIKGGDGVNFRVISIDVADEDQKLYKIINNNGSDLSAVQLDAISGQGVYNNARAALDQFTILEEEYSDGSTFKFDGLTLIRGQFVYDKVTGEEFRVAVNRPLGDNIQLVTPEDYGKPYADRKQKAITESELDFSERYYDEKLIVDKVPDGTAKITADNIANIYVRENAGESKESAEKRLSWIINNLTDNVYNNLVIDVKPNPNKAATQFSYGGVAQPNKYILTKGEPYNIQIRIKDELTLLEVNQKLQAVGLQPISDKNNGIIGNIANSSYIYKVGVNEFTPSTMSTDLAKNIFNVDTSKTTIEQELAKAIDSTTRKDVLVNFLNKQYASGITEITFESLKENGFSIVREDGYPDYNTDNPLTVLSDFYKAGLSSDGKGGILIYDITRDKNGESVGEPEVISNLIDDELKVLEKEAKEGLQNGLWSKMLGPNTLGYTERYQYVIKQPNGVYTLATAKTIGQDKTIISQFVTGMMDKVIELKEGNKEKNIKPSINEKGNYINGQTQQTVGQEIDVFNLENNKSIRIAMVPGFDVTINVAPFGKIRAVVEKNRSKITTTYLELSEIKASSDPLKQLNDLLKKINADLDVAGYDTVNISLNQFTTSLSLNADVQTTLESLGTKLSPRVRRNSKLNFETTSAANQASFDKDVNLSAEDNTNKILNLGDKITTNAVFTETLAFTDAEGNPIPVGEEKTATSTDGSIDLASITQSPLDQLNVKLKEIEDTTKKEVGARGLTKALRNDPVYQKLKQARDKLISNKVVTNFTAEDVQSLNDFTVWAQNNLPDSITLADINVLGSNLLKGGVRVGGFALNMNALAGNLKIGGTIYTGASNPFKYHEAFHAVYRLLLTPEEQVKLRAIARKEVRSKLRKENKSFTKELQKFKNTSEQYDNLSLKELQNLFYEEYMADEFNKFKLNPRDTNTDSVVKSWFTKLLDWIKGIFSKYTKTQLQSLYENIDSGRYAQAESVSNEFTDNYSNEIVIANAVIPYEQVQVGTSKGQLFLDSSVANNIVLTMAATFVERQQQDPKVSREDRMSEILDDFEWLYSVDNPSNQSNMNDGERSKLLQKITDSFIYSNSYEDLTESPYYKAAFDVLDTIDFQKAEEVEEADSLEQDQGLRNVTQYGKEAYLNGSFSSLSSYFRKYLATITRAESDIFGNTTITRKDNREEKLIVPINVYNTYNGIMKAMEGRTEPMEIVQSLALFSTSNPDTKAAVNKIFTDLGITMGESVSDMVLPTKIKNSILFNQLKAFSNFKVEWLFQKTDNNGSLITFSAAERDDANTQLSLWSQAYTSLLQEWKIKPKERNSAVKSVSSLRQVLLSGKKFNDQKLDDSSKNAAKQIFDNTGISLSPQYIKFSILKSNGTNEKHPDQELLLSLNTNAEPITAEQLYFISEIIKSKETAHELYSDEKGAAGRLKSMAVNNAIFDESIGLSVFKNVNGDLVNAHQKPTYHLKRIKELNYPAKLQELSEKEYLSNNYLLNNDKFKAMSDANMLSVQRVSGVAEVKTLDRDVDYDQYISGVLNTTEYGSFTAGQFMANLINNYTLDFNPKTNKLKKSVVVNQETGLVEQIATSPIQIRILESSNTNDMTTLPVTIAVSGKNADITDTIIDASFDFVKNEYDRIVKEQGENRTKDSYKGYDDRKLSFVNNSDLISEELRKSLEVSAQQKVGETLEKHLTFKEALKNNELSEKQFKDQLRNNLEIKYKRFKSLYDTLKIDNKISNEIKSGIVQDRTGVDRANAVAAAEKLNLRKDLDYNLRQIFFNDYINTKSINELLLGDQALILKDSVDKIKRAKGQNAAFDNVYTNMVDTNLGVDTMTENISVLTFDDPILNSWFTGQGIERADAQVYLTTKAFRNFWFGLGKLTKSQADVITKIERGERITSSDIFDEGGLIQTDGMLNSKKFVHFDGEQFIKMSAFVLSPSFTSIDTGKKDNDGNVIWEENPLRPELHKLREDLETIQRNTGNVAIATPVSAQKMAKKNVQLLDESISEPSSIISAKDFGLQVVNPSNKNSVTEVSQIKLLATNEQEDSQQVNIPGYPALTNIKKVKAFYNDALKKRVVLKFKNKRNLVFTFDGVMSEFNVSKERNNLTPDLASFLSYAINSLKASKSSSNVIEFFSIDPVSGQPKFDFNNPLAIAKAEQLFLSYFTKGVFQEKIPGHGLALVSDFGNNIYRRVFSVEEIKDEAGNSKFLPLRHEVIRESDAVRMKALDVKQFSMAELAQKQIPKEGIVVIDRLRYGLQEFDDKGRSTKQRYSESMMPAHFKDVFEKVAEKGGAIPEMIAKMFAVRIPSQDNHSTMNIKLVDFMPVYYGSSAMFAAELVEVSGADFDIDKVYTQILEYYYSKEEKKFFQYGATQGRQYKDYVEYINTKVKQDTIYAEALKSFKVQGSRLEDSYDDNFIIDQMFTDDALKAVTRLGLPVTKAQYQKYKEEYGEPYEAPINNAVLNMRYALMGNEAVQDISYTPATLDAVKEAYASLEKFAPGYTQSMNGSEVDVDDINGKVISFINNKGAAIGRAVSPNLAISLLSEYKIKLPGELQFSILNKPYTGFDTATTTEGKRKQDTISAIITMLTDNSKENFMSKLGMHKQAVPRAVTMVALGIPLSDAILILNSKIARDLFEQASNKIQKFDAGFKGLVNQELAFKQGQIKDGKILGIDLSTGIKTREDLGGLVEGGGSFKQELELLEILSTVNTINEFIGNMNSLTGISGSAGLGKNFADIASIKKDLQKIGAIEKIGENPVIDISRILENSFVKQNLDIFNEITNELLPQVFLTATPVFNELYEKLEKSFAVDAITFNEETEQKIRRDMLSYFTIKAYMHNNANTQDKDAGTLSNKLIYPMVDAQNIYDSIRRLNAADNDNFFLKSFVTQLPVNAESNKTGINILAANTWRNLNKLQKIDLQTSFAKLYGNPATRKDASTIVNYIMVKDGLQLSKDSLLEAISPFVMDSYLQQIETAKESLLNDKDYKDAFGLTKDELFNEFENGYLSSNVGMFNLTFKEVRTDVDGSSDTQTSIKGKTALSKDGVLTLSAPKNSQVDGAFVFENQPKYLRYYTETDTGFGVERSNKLFLLREDQEKSTSFMYDEVPFMGSNYQNAIGFMFGARDTYATVRNNISNKTDIIGNIEDMLGIDQVIDSLDIENLNLDRSKSISARALRTESANVSATEDSVEFQIDSAAVPVNIAQVNADTLLESLTTPTEQTSKVEISSNAKGLAAALTNPTELAKSKGNLAESYPITFNGKNYKDVEAAYQALKDKSEARTKPTKENSNNYRLMVDLISAKLEQHPRLISSITEKGGVDWISSSTHQPTKQNTVWETGGQDWFIESLADAYRSTQPATQSREQANIKTETEGILSAENNMPELTSKQNEQLDLFDAALEDKYPLITVFYNETINAPYIADEFTEMRKNLADNNIVSLKDLTALYENETLSYEGKTEEEKIKNFLEEIKRCNL